MCIFLPLPVRRVRAGVRVISNEESRLMFEITLTLKPSPGLPKEGIEQENQEHAIALPSSIHSCSFVSIRGQSDYAAAR